MLDKENTDVASNTQTKAVGTGPFVFQEWKQGESMRFTKNPNYWQTGTPYLDEIVVNVRKDAQSMVADLEAGSLQMAFAPDTAGLPPPEVRPQLHRAVVDAGRGHVPDPAQRDVQAAGRQTRTAGAQLRHRPQAHRRHGPDGAGRPRGPAVASQLARV